MFEVSPFERGFQTGEAAAAAQRLLSLTRQLYPMHQEAIRRDHPERFLRHFLVAFLKDSEPPEEIAREFPEVAAVGPAQTLILHEEMFKFRAQEAADNGRSLSHILQMLEVDPWTATMAAIIWTVRDKLDLTRLAHEGNLRKFYAQNRDAIIAEMKTRRRGNTTLAMSLTGMNEPWVRRERKYNIAALGEAPTGDGRPSDMIELLPESDLNRVAGMTRDEIMHRFDTVATTNPVFWGAWANQNMDASKILVILLVVSSPMQARIMKDTQDIPDDLSRLRALYGSGEKCSVCHPRTFKSGIYNFLNMDSR